jgi:hypothetical protein
VVKYLPSKHKALSSNTSTEKQKEKSSKYKYTILYLTYNIYDLFYVIMKCLLMLNTFVFL